MSAPHDLKEINRLQLERDREKNKLPPVGIFDEEIATYLRRSVGEAYARGLNEGIATGKQSAIRTIEAMRVGHVGDLPRAILASVIAKLRLLGSGK